MEKYCSNCGELLILKHLDNEGDIPYCPKCNEFHFPKFNIAISTIIINKSNNKILLIKQYGKDAYILVAGYVAISESLEEALIREVKEETGMSVSSFKYNRSKYFEKSNTLMCNFTSFVKSDEELNTNNEIDSYSWFTKDEALENIKDNSLAKEFLVKYLSE